jgi:outer membrane protein assembly factor BamB
VSEKGIVYLMSGFRGNALMAVRLSDARGDVTGTEAIVWSLDRDTPYVPSPLLYRGTLYFLKGNTGILSAFDAGTGERFYQERLRDLGNIYASPVGADGRVYVTDREGRTVVLKAGREPEVLATNSLEDGFDASMAVAGDEIYLRGSSLYRISAPE